MINFFELPDYLSDEELEQLFFEFISIYQGTRDNVEYALDVLFELADRQWHTYTTIRPEVKTNIEIYLFSVINLESETIMDSILTIIPRLGLKKVFEYILNVKDNISNVKIINEIEGANHEYGEHVDNPYFGM